MVRILEGMAGLYIKHIIICNAHLKPRSGGKTTVVRRVEAAQRQAPYGSWDGGIVSRRHAGSSSLEMLALRNQRSSSARRRAYRLPPGGRGRPGGRVSGACVR